MFKRHWILALVLLAGCSAPAVEWTEGEPGADGRAQHTLVLSNVPGGSRLWFQELYDRKEVTEPSGLEFKHFQGTSFYLDVPADAPRELTIRYFGRPLPRRSWAPEGFVLQQKGKEDRPLETVYHFRELPDVQEDTTLFPVSAPVGPADIIPRVKKMEVRGTPRPISEIVYNDVLEEHPAGWYSIVVRDSVAQVFSSDEEGLRYARLFFQKRGNILPEMDLEDWPDMPYRGLMLDVVRDFRTVEEVKAILDIMALYKLNRLHFHLADDESWCLEMKRLPALTAFSGHHALPEWDLVETRALKPTANGKIGNVTFYTEEEYKTILRYAGEKGIQVIPEFDTPGHSRSSIKAMIAYEKATGDTTYRLQDPADTSRYWSAQDFKDNVLDPELPGVYKFYGLVFDEVIRMHREAGVPLPAIHIGGDEVPGGVWSGRDHAALKDLFTNRMLDLAEERGVLLAGWQELALGILPQTQERLKRSLYFLNAWSTNDKAALTYRLADEGFPMLLCNVDNTYVDLAYSADPREIGLHWGGYVNERSTFALNPGRLPTRHPECIIGAQANLWSENLRSQEDATYQLLPKALGVWERAWNAHPAWRSEEEFNADFGRFYSIVVQNEMPLWDEAGYKYKKRF